jgi:hypothetical protein
VRNISGTKTFRSILRKERFKSDATNGVLRVPQVVRNIEVIAAPPGVRDYRNALLVQNGMTMKGGEVFDSYDSRDPSKSTGGKYDPAKRQSNCNLASNSTGGISDLKGANVFGDASSNGGMMQNTGGVRGNVYNNFSATLAPVTKPIWTSFNMFPTAISAPAIPVTLVGGTAAAPQNYKLTDLSVKSKTGPLILAPHLPGQESYINIWVTGDMAITSNGCITQQPGVHVKIFVEGNIVIGGGGMVNDTGSALNLEVLGVTPASGTRTATFTSNIEFSGVINAPSYDFTFSGTADIYGAMVGKTAYFNGNPGIHYDEALLDVISPTKTKYEFVSWVEDVR